MKKIFYVFCLLAVVGLTLSTTSCISTEKIVYLQGADTLYAVPQQIQQAFELEIQPDDELAISVSSRFPEAIAKFNNNTLIGGGTNSMTGSNTANTTSRVAYFLVDKEGNIEFPIFGTINTRNKTCKQLAQELQLRFQTNEVEKIKDAVVNVKVMSFKVTVLGDVKNPGTQTFQGERLTLLEAIGKAGDMNGSALREHVLVVREIGDKRVTYDVDIRDPQQVFDSPAYYLQQNDIIYVQPNKSVRVKGSTGYTLLSVLATAVSVLVSVVSLVIALTKK
ncbi:MAG: polysaccharide biosynthesis/export family protein [Bacteroidaceae bacterium]|nr:polysaccharide biosynthesis/export family protein [Bacteroidaceae bacterium]